MKLSSQRIEVHFKEAMDLAKQLRLLADQVKNIGRRDIPSIGTAAKRGMRSECVDILVKKELAAGEMLGEEGEELQRLAGEMEEQAREMYLAEMTNSVLAATRIY